MITKADTVEELLELYPGINRYLMKKGIHCIRCGEPVWATLGELIHERDLDEETILEELNRLYQPKAAE